MSIFLLRMEEGRGEKREAVVENPPNYERLVRKKKERRVREEGKELRIELRRDDPSPPRKKRKKGQTPFDLLTLDVRKKKNRPQPTLTAI